MMARLDEPLAQRGRASLEFVASVGRWLGKATRDIDASLRAQVDDEALPEDLDAIDRELRARLEPTSLYTTREFGMEWYLNEHGRIAIEAFEEIAPRVTPRLHALDTGPATLEPAPEDWRAPAYWQDVWIHRMHGGWDGHPYMGYVHGQLIHKALVDRLYPGGIFKQRRYVAALAPKRDYSRILEVGTSSGQYTLALAETFPQAEIFGVDLSLRMLEHALRTANARGLPWRLFQRCAHDTGFADASFDLVTSYILLHELPAQAIEAVFQEAFRVLRPGGDVLMSDVSRYADLDAVRRWWADHGARHGGEPWWRESASLDLAAVARAAGFQDIRACGDVVPGV